MTQRPFDCLVAGDANIDILVEGVTALEVGAEKLATDLNLVLGGSSSITAFNLSRLGARVTFAGVIGEDSFGQLVREKLVGAQVDVTGLMQIPNAKTGVTIWHTDCGRRAGVTYPGTVAMLQAEDITDSLLLSAKHLHVGAYFLLTRLHPDAPEFFARAKRLGLTTSVDCNYDPEERLDSNLPNVLRHSDLFFPNEDEAVRITGRALVSEAARELAALGATIVIKRGANGALVANSHIQFAVPAQPARVVDTTGAGDSFNAGFLSEFVKGSSLEICAQAAVLAGARSTESIGGTAAFER